MKTTSIMKIMLVLAAAAALAGCGDSADQAQSNPPASDTQAAAPAADPNIWRGTVVETMDAASYTYLELDTGKERLWIAGPATSIKVGDEVSVPKGMLMPNFHSKALERDFPEIYFVSAIYPAGSAPQTSAPHGGMGGMTAAPRDTDVKEGAASRITLDDAEVEGITKIEGGYTVEDMFTRGAELNGQTVKIRGRVVKFTPNIMGTNWVHLQDGTGSGDTVDLTVTTSAAVNVGDVIVAEGVLAVDKDFGAGYRYPAIVEQAEVIKE